VGRFAKGIVNLQTKDRTPEGGKPYRVAAVNLDPRKPSDWFHAFLLMRVVARGSA
jgi:hypothetical protein